MMTAPDTATMLVIDDEREMVQAIERTLRGPSLTIRSFTDPVRALDDLAAAPVDLVLSDIDMPQMSGLDLLATVRTLQPGAARMVLSGVTSIEAAIRAINDGAVHRFMRKPFDPQELRTTVRDAIENARRANQLRDHQAQRQAWEERLRQVDPRLAEPPRNAAGVYLLDPGTIEHNAARHGLEHLVRAFV